MPSKYGGSASRRIGFIVGKTCDAVEDPLFLGDCSFLKSLPNDLRVNSRRNKYLKYCEATDTGKAHVDVAIAWYIHTNYPDLKVDIIEPGEVSAERLSGNVCNFIIGWDLIDAALEGPERLLDMTNVFRTCGNIVPSLEVQEFIYYKSRYLKACVDAGIPIAPTIFVLPGQYSAWGLLEQIKARGWKEFVIKKSFNCWSLGFVRYSVAACEKSPEVLDKYFTAHIDCPEFIVQEALSGFARHWETRVFWWGGKFVYAIANKAAVATQSKEMIIAGRDIPDEFLENAKSIGHLALSLLPELQTPEGQRTGMTLIRTDIGCSDGPVLDRETHWDPDKKTFFLNEIEYGGTNYFARHLKFDCVPMWAEKYANKASEILERDGPLRLRRGSAMIPSAAPRLTAVPRPMQPHLTFRDAAEWLAHADFLLIGSGSEMGAGEGLFKQFRDPSWLKMDVPSAWGFWHSCYNKFADSRPHAGYKILRSLADLCGLAFSITSNIDAHWTRSGWPRDQILELNGSVLRLQCLRPECSAIWPSDVVDGSAKPGDVPSCPGCGEAMRPAVRLSGSDNGFSEEEVAAQSTRYGYWHSTASHYQAMDASTTCVCLELGCDPDSPTREVLSAACEGRCRLIRVNSDRADAAVTQTPDRPAISMHMNVLNALYELQRQMQSIELAVFICQDANGNGAEFTAPMDSCLSHVIRKTVAEAGWVFHVAADEGPLECEVHNVNRETERLDLAFHDSVPANFFSRFERPGYEAPVTRVIVRHAYFGMRNARLEARSSIVYHSLRELNEGFRDPEYQRRLEEAKDRVTVQALIREVQVRLMAKHGWPVEGAKPKHLHDLVLQMKGFNWAAMHGQPHLQELVDESFVLSGRNRLDALPCRWRRPLPPEVVQQLQRG